MFQETILLHLHWKFKHRVYFICIECTYFSSKAEVYGNSRWKSLMRRLEKKLAMLICEMGPWSNFSFPKNWRGTEVKLWETLPVSSVLTKVQILHVFKHVYNETRWWLSWADDCICVLCKNAPESRDHLYFWVFIVLSSMGTSGQGDSMQRLHNRWYAIVRLINDLSMEKKKLLCIRYAFQAAVHTLWREINKIKHDDKPMLLPALKKW